MIGIRRVTLLLIASLFFSAPAAYAGGGGGGGTKRPSQIIFTNNSSLVVGVTTDATSSAITTAITDKNVAEFLAAGGKFISVGGTATFRVSAGTYQAGAVDQAFANTIVSTSVTVAKGQTVYVTITNNPEVTGALLISSSTTAPVSGTTTVTSAAAHVH
jgi:hypothetical protein